LKPHQPRRAFTLIEVLVVIAIIALLIGILLPALGGGRESSRRLLALSNARSVTQTFGLYLGANDDVYPFIQPGSMGGMPGGPGGIAVRWYPENTFIATSDVFGMEWAWPAVVSSITPWTEAYPTWVSPGMPTELPSVDDIDPTNPDFRPEEMISWRYANGFVADPDLWTDNPPTEEPIRAVRDNEVQFPSQKVLLWDTHLAFLRARPDLTGGHWNAKTPMAFPDGHADTENPTEATEPVANVRAFGRALRLHDTAEGVRGFDYE